MTRLHYLAYGSNLHPLRILERVPSATFLGVVPMPGRSVRFHKKSKDDSGKCDLIESNAAALAYGALYEFDLTDKPELDAAEGLGHGYRQATVSFQLNNVTYNPFVYVASISHVNPSLNPYHWYKQLVLRGASYHRFPEEYIAELESVPSISDPNAERSAKNEALLARMAEFCPSFNPDWRKSAPAG